MNSQYFLRAKEAYGANIGHPSDSKSYHVEEYFSSGEHEVDEVGGQVQELSISGEILTPDTSPGCSATITLERQRQLHLCIFRGVVVC